MSYLPSSIEDTTFKSERLVYRAVDKEADLPLRNRLANNPRSDSMINPFIQTPDSLETTADHMKSGDRIVS